MIDVGGKEPCPECGKSLSVQNDSSALQAGTVLKKNYLIGRTLGSGGFGTTYLAYDLSLESRVAIKEFLPRQIASRTSDKVTVQPTKEDAETYKYGLLRFIEEARMLRRFNHPSIITVYSCFKENNTAYFDMPFIPGKTLEQYVIEQGRGISEEELSYIMMQILEGLEIVHNQKVYHRDIKPANIYIPDEGFPVLLDFGAARQEMVNKSQTFSIYLTPGYAPFEQYTKTRTQGTYTDIYGCAATMYSCLEGNIKKGRNKRFIAPPISAPDRKDGKILPQVRDVSSHKITDSLANAIMKGLEFDPENRPQSVSEFRKLIELAPSPTPNPEYFELLVIAGDFEGEKLPLSSKPIIIGRSPKRSALVLSDDTISATHCQIYALDGVVCVKDLNSRNGTWINDTKKLKPSETVRIGMGDTISLAGCEVFKVVEGERISVPFPEPKPEPFPTPSATSSVPDYAGFWKRFGASLIDAVPIFIAFVIVEAILGDSATNILSKIGQIPITPLLIIRPIILWLYYAGMERSSKQGTLGKIACGLVVTDLSGRRISFWRATVRFFSKIISSIILGVGFIMAGFTIKKQALHDMIAGCLVVYDKKNK
jgi:serine/threonine protein kinase